MRSNILISSVQLVTLVASLASQVLLALHIGPGVSLDAYFSAFGFSAAVLGGLVVASTYLIPPYINDAEKDTVGGAKVGAGEVLVAFLGIALVLIFCGQLFLLVMRNKISPSITVDYIDVLIFCGWSTAFLTVLTSVLTAIGVANKVILKPMVSGALPTLCVVAYLIISKSPAIKFVALVTTGGVLFQVLFLAWILRMHWTVKNIYFLKVTEVIRKIPLAAAGAICFSGYAAVDSVLGLHLGVGVLSHQALAQRLVIAFGAVLSAGPFLQAPTQLGEFLSAGLWDGIRNYVIRASLVMIGLTATASFLMPSIGVYAIELMFQYGNFSAHDTFAVSQVVSILLLGAGPMLSTAIVFRAMHTLHLSKYVAIISLFWFFAYASFSMVFINYFGVNSLAAAYAISWVAAFVFSLLVLLRHLDKCKSKINY